MMAKSPLFSGLIKKLRKRTTPKVTIPYPLLNPFLILCIIWYGLVTTQNQKVDFLSGFSILFLDFQDFDSQHTVFSSHIEKTRVPGH